MAVLGLRFCARAFSSCGKWGPLFIAVRGPLIIAASLAAEHRLQTRRLSSCGSRAQLLRGMWDPPRPGLEPVSPALAGRFSTTVPPGKPFTFLNVGHKSFSICDILSLIWHLCWNRPSHSIYKLLEGWDYVLWFSIISHTSQYEHARRYCSGRDSRLEGGSYFPVQGLNLATSPPGAGG